MKNDEESNNSKIKGHLNKGEEDEMEIYGYKDYPPYRYLTWTCTILTIGILRLIFHWWPKLHLYATHKSCPLDLATKLLIVDSFEKRFKSSFVKEVKRIPNRLKNRNKTTDIVTNSDQDLENSNDKLITIHLADGTVREVKEIRMVRVKKLSYIWSSEENMFIKLIGLDNGLKQEDFFNFKGYSALEQKQKQLAYGMNEIIVPISTIPALVILEILNPFYIFQMFALTVWLCDEYYYYSMAIIIMSLFGVSSSVIQTHQNQKNLYETINSTDIVTVKRKTNEYEEISTSQLVPGDIIVIPPQGCTVHCDAVLLNGNCIVNESMLTGESVPVVKTQVSRKSLPYNMKENTHYTLFCGTKVIQTRYYGSEKVHAVVIRTGFLTAKGNLVRSILYPPPADFKFDQDSFKFMWVLGSIALIGFLYTVYIKVSRGMDISEIIIKSFDLFTIAIPVALPASMTVGKIHALRRLKKAKISCINSRVINVSGSLNCICFDKTGTLTEDGLDLWGVLPISNKSFETPCQCPSQNNQEHLLLAMATCHSLTLIDGVISGDPLDTKMFEATKWILEEPTVPDESKYDLLVPTVVRPPPNAENVNKEVGILHQFQFSSKLQRMSVVTRKLGDTGLTLYCKGSPEMILSLSNSDSVPPNLLSKLKEYTEQGFRVIALAWKNLESVVYHKLDKIQREEVERDLTMVGLVILENRLKPQTIPTINMLKQAEIKIVMITGDNIQTAVSVAKECGIISKYDTAVEVNLNTTHKGCEFNYTKIASHVDDSIINGTSKKLTEEGLHSANYKIATTGRVWESIREKKPELLPKLVLRAVVFARMTSDQKQQVIIELQNLGYFVAMCGDGANDCGALRAAHVGISLSEAEASVASPFTSQEPNISCVVNIIKEGRAALVTSFGVFKFMILYSLTEFFSTIFLYRIDSNITDFQFLFIDIALVVNFAFFFGHCKAYKGPIVAQTPLPSMLNIIPIVSLLLQVFTLSAIQMISYNIVRHYLWFEPFHYHLRKHYASYENYAIYTVSQFQYITTAVVFSQGPPYREPIYTNRIFFMSILCLTAICIYITLSPANWIISILQLRYPPNKEFPLIVIVLGFANFCICFFLEEFVVNYILFTKLKLGISKSNVMEKIC